MILEKMWLGKESQRLGAEEIRGRKTLPVVSLYPLRSSGLGVYGTVDRWDLLTYEGEVCHYGCYSCKGLILAILGS